MAQVHAGDRLTAEDAAFLYLEKEDAPLHIGSVSIFDGIIPFDSFVSYVESRLPLIARYRQRLVMPPFHVGHPTWETDPAFDIRNHIFLEHLKRGSDSDLRVLAGRIFSKVMDRNAPLWDIYLVHGLAGNRSAMIMRVHHCLVDGVSGVGLMNVMLNADTAAAIPPQPHHEHVRPLPGPETSLADALASSYSEMVERFLAAQSVTLDLAQSIVNPQAAGAFTQLVRMLPEMLTAVERLPFNRPLAGPRHVAWSEFSLAEVKKIKDARGATVNDVVLAIVTGAVGRYAALHKVRLKNRLLRLMVPVNVRTRENDSGYGNRVSMLPVNIPLDIRDPLKLLAAINRTTTALKNTRVADLISLFATWVGATPAPVQALLGPLAALLPLPPFNLVCTNVPGPQFPLYALGHEMLTYHPYVPIGSEMGVGCAVQSYNNKLYFGLTGDVEAAPDLNRLKTFLDQSFVDLRRAAGVPSTRKPRARRAKPPQPAVAAVAAD